MDKLNFYSGQLVNHNDLQTFQNNVENKDKELTQKLFGYGIVDGFGVSPNSPADLTVLVAPGFAVDQYGQTVKLLQQRQVNLAGYVPSANSRYVTLYAMFTRKEYETRQNDIGEEIKYRWDEDSEITIVAGDVSGSPVKPNVSSEGVLLADILLTEGQTQITTIDNARRLSLVSLLQHKLNTNNPHAVKMSQLADTTLPADMNANGKKIIGLTAASSNTEPIRKQDIINLSTKCWTANWYVSGTGDKILASVNITLEYQSVVFIVVTSKCRNVAEGITSWIVTRLGIEIDNNSVGNLEASSLYVNTAYYLTSTNNFVTLLNSGNHLIKVFSDPYHDDVGHIYEGIVSILSIPRDLSYLNL